MNPPNQPASYVLQIWGSQGGGDEHPIQKATLSLGRNRDNDVILDDRQVSGRHAKLAFSANQFSVMDLGSLNGTRLNGNPLSAREPNTFRPGDVISVGGFNIGVRAVSADSPAPAAVAERVKFSSRPQPGISLYTGHKLDKYPLDQPSTTIGRATDNAITINHPICI